MIRKQKKRAARGKQTAFRRSGQEVDQKRIARFVRRYGSSWNQKRDKDAELQSPEPRSSTSIHSRSHLTQLAIATPSDMTCYTPEPAEEASAVTPSSPPEIQSPSRETPNYQMNFGTPSINSTSHLVSSNYTNRHQTQTKSTPSPTSSSTTTPPTLWICTPTMLTLNVDPTTQQIRHPTQSQVSPTRYHTQYHTPSQPRVLYIRIITTSTTETTSTLQAR